MLQATPSSPTGQPANTSPANLLQQAAGTRSDNSAHVRTTSDADFWKEVQASLNSLVGSQDQRSVFVVAGGVKATGTVPIDEIARQTNYVALQRLLVGNLGPRRREGCDPLGFVRVRRVRGSLKRFSDSGITSPGSHQSEHETSFETRPRGVVQVSGEEGAQFGRLRPTASVELVAGLDAEQIHAP